MEEALNALHLPIGTYEHPGPNGNDPIYAIDFQELRNKIKDAWTALASTSSLTQAYDGDGLRVKKTEYGWSTFYLRSSVLGGQVISEIGVSAGGGTAEWQRGYVYAGSGLMAVQQQGGVFWTFEDPVTKSKRVTDVNGTTVSAIETDPWGADTNRSFSQAFQPKRFTSYERDGNASDEAMFRRYNRWHSRFDQPDPYDGSYDLGDPQSLNRYAYVQSDPVNFIDPTGLDPDFGLGPPPPVPILVLPYGGTIVTNTSAPRYPGGGDNSLLFYRGVSGLGERFSRMLYDPGASGRDLIPQNTTGHPAQDKLPFNDCSEFVDWLAGLANDTAQRNSRLGSWGAAAGLGARMMHIALNEYDSYGNNGFDGFKYELARQGGQNQGVYSHVIGNAGAVLAGSSAIIAGNHLKDMAQTKWGNERHRNEGPAEQAGNIAGVKVGTQMQKFILGRRDLNRLKTNLKSILCDPYN